MQKILKQNKKRSARITQKKKIFFSKKLIIKMQVFFFNIFMLKLNFRKILKIRKLSLLAIRDSKGILVNFMAQLSWEKVIGISNEIPTKPSVFKKLNLKNNCKSLKVNIKNLRQIQKIFSKENLILFSSCSTIIS